MSPRLLVVGEALVDVVPRPGGGRPVEVPGGSPANVALALGRLGRHVTLVTVLADDARGRAVREHLAASGVDVRCTAPASGRTSTAVVTLAEDGIPSYAFDLTWDLPAVDITAADVVHLGSVSALIAPGADAVRDAARRARTHAVVALDPNVRPGLSGDRARAAEQIEELVALADVVKVSDEDLAWLYPGEDPVSVGRRWATGGAGVVVVTRGADGSTVVRPGGTTFDVPGRRVVVADTVGAGDTFMGALLDALAEAGVHGPQGRGRLLRLPDAALGSATGRAAVAASVTVSRAGCQPPTRAELAAATDGRSTGDEAVL